MDEFITLTEYNWAFWVAGLFALLEFGKWLYSFKDFLCEKLGIRTKGMIKREEFENRLKKVESDIVEIKNTSVKNVNMFLDHEKQVVDQVAAMRNEILKELSKLHVKVDSQAKDFDESRADTMRHYILNFARECRNKEEHSEEEWNHVIAQLKKYEALCAEKEIENGVIEENTIYIRGLYRKRLRERE